MFARGGIVENPSEALRLFSLCQSMKWNHLPVAGGIYDQDPRLIDEWEIIFAAIGKVQQEEKMKADAESAKIKAKRGR